MGIGGVCCVCELRSFVDEELRVGGVMQQHTLNRKQGEGLV